MHGKNSWQYEATVPSSLGAGSKIVCRHEIKLDIAHGDYVFEIGLASIASNIWKRREQVSHEEMSVKHVRNCHIANVGSFSVGMAYKDNISVLSHHGIANLPGSMSIAVEAAKTQDKLKESCEGQPPTIFHITHWKAGSQWLYKILRQVALERIIIPQLEEKQFLLDPLISSSIYPTLYVTKEQFHSVALPINYRKFIIIRDLRDTLVSAYFSWAYSHQVLDDSLIQLRERLHSLTVEQGLLMLMDEWLWSAARIQKSWIGSGYKVIRYEDLLEKDTQILEELLIGYCEIKITPERLSEIIVANRFENLTGGRKPGNEDIIAHERKGVSGDWRNYFTPLVTQKFTQQFGRIHLDAGYSLTE